MSSSTEKNSNDEISLIDLFQAFSRFVIRVLLKIKRDWINYSKVLMIAFIFGAFISIIKSFVLEKKYATQAIVYSRYLRGGIFIESVKDFDNLLEAKKYDQIANHLGISVENTPLTSLVGIFVDTLNQNDLIILDENYYRFKDGYFKVEFYLKDSLKNQKELAIIQELFFRYISSIETVRQFHYLDSVTNYAQRERYKNEIRSVEQVRNAVVNQIAEGKITSSPLSISLADGASISHNLPIELHRETIRLYERYLTIETYINLMSPLNYLKPFGEISKPVKRKTVWKRLSNNFIINLFFNALLLGVVCSVIAYFIIVAMGFNKWLAQQENKNQQS